MTKSKRIRRRQYNIGIGFLRIDQILDIIPIGKSTWWKWVSEGKAPPGIKLGPKTTVWKYQDILNLMAKFEEVDNEKA